jgi:DNA-binding response OmpR family regulator
MLTARGQEIDKVLGLKLGADDYVTKPFSFMELRARVDAVLRRASPARGLRNGGTHEFGSFKIDLDHHIAHKDGVELSLTPREFRLLGHFIEHRGEVVTREQLLDHVWGYDTIPFTRTVDTHIAKLRKKIEDNPADPHLIVTVHRLGYKFVG